LSSFLCCQTSVLDDTGSAYLEIFEDDRLALDIFPALLYVFPPVELITASVPIYQNVISVQAKILDQTYQTIGESVDTLAVFVPEFQTRARCSGMLVRKSLFTATAPDGQGLLHVAEKKNGIVRHLPIV
jgi:hypothetical protein